MDKRPILKTEIAKDNCKVVYMSLRELYLNGAFEKFTDKEKDSYNRAVILLQNTIEYEWK